MCMIKYITHISVLFTFHFIGLNSLEINERCTTPNGESATCISIYRCSTLFNVINTTNANQLQFLQKSQCGYSDVPLVCCGTMNNYGTIPSRDDFRVTSRISCGFQETDYIFGGENTAMDEFPWLALLQYELTGGRKRFSCGGSLISHQYVLTAAHCIDTKIGKLIKVRLGEWNTRTERDCIEAGRRQICNSSPIDVGIGSTIVHEKFDKLDESSRNDIGLIRLKQRIEFTNFIRPICLPPLRETPEIGEKLTVAGWGKTENNRFSDIKKKVVVPIFNRSICAEKFATRGLNLGEGQICAGGEKNRDSCAGDSGGPLMKTSTNELSQWYVEGIVSLGRACGIEGWPGIYTQVSFYLDWIYKNVR